MRLKIDRRPPAANITIANVTGDSYQYPRGKEEANDISHLRRWIDSVICRLVLHKSRGRNLAHGRAVLALALVFLTPASTRPPNTALPSHAVSVAFCKPGELPRFFDAGPVVGNCT